MLKIDRSTAVPIAVVVALAALIGLASSADDSKVRLILLLAALLPVALVASIRYPLLALGALIGAQLADAYQIHTPVASISLRSFLLVFLVATQGPAILTKIRATRSLRFVVLILFLWILSSLLRLYHDPLDSVLRSMVTQVSFTGIVFVGAVLADSRNAVFVVACAASLSLLVLSAAGALASLGYLPLPQRFAADRTIFGLSSPFIRNYGLNVSYDAVALLSPLCIPFLVIRLLRRDVLGPTRLWALSGFLAVVAGIVLVFQARGMLIQVGLACTLAAGLVWRGIRAVVFPVATALLVIGFSQLVNTDQISSGIRLATDQAVVSEATSHWESFWFGSNPSNLFDNGVAQAGYSLALPPGTGAVVHNAFLENLATGGIVQLAVFSVLQIYMVVRAFQFWRSGQDPTDSQVLLLASILVMFELNLEPAAANVVGSWLILGLVIGRTFSNSVKDAGRPELIASRPIKPVKSPRAATSFELTSPGGRSSGVEQASVWHSLTHNAESVRLAGTESDGQ